MPLNQEYIKSLNVPSVNYDFIKQKIIFKTGNLLTNRYIEMLNRIPKQDGFYVFKHTKTLFTLCFIRGDVAQLIGPEIIVNQNNQTNPALNSLFVRLPHNFETVVLKLEQAQHQINLVANMLGISLDTIDTDNLFTNFIFSNDIGYLTQTINFNEQGTHINYQYEQALKLAVKSGNAARIHTVFQKLINSGRIGILSNEGTLRAMKNWGIICISVVLRAAIEAGMDYEQAYSLNDKYVMELEATTLFGEVLEKIEESLKNMALKVHDLKNTHLSQNVRAVYQIILNTPEQAISVKQFSDRLQLSSNYLSTCFKQEIGCSIAQFKVLSKINKAIHLMLVTDLPLIEIAAELNFSDQAHLSREFKKYVGVSPSISKKQPHYLNDWNLYDYLDVNVG